ncbi:MAG: hypothetical protein AB7K68_04645 [Bacteriovoracia bacterium]
MLKKLALTLFSIGLLGTSSAAYAEFGGHVGAHLGIGNEGGGGQPVGNTSIGTLDLHLMPGFRLFGKSLMPGVLMNLRFLSQLAGSNRPGKELSGSGSLFGLALVYEFDVFKILASYDFRARHAHSNPDSTFKGSGYTLLFGYKTLPDFYVDLEFNSTSYSSREVAGIVQTFDKPALPLAHWNLALGLSYSF